MGDEIDLYVPCHMAESETSGLWRKFQQQVRASTTASGCESLLTKPWSSASSEEGRSKDSGWKALGFISGC